MTSIFNRPLAKAQAVTELEAWIQKIQVLRLNCFDSFVGTLRKWMEKSRNREEPFFKPSS